jgi:UDP:flavonoid glycosyltransferase YjiC (YdhE family)
MLPAMRVLVSSTPGWGHVAPMLPVVDEVQRRGHRIVWVTAEDVGSRLVDRGYDVQVHGLPLGERLARARSVLAERAADIPPRSMRAHAFTTHFALLAAPAAIDGVRSVASSFRPDVIVREPAELASMIVARSSGIPAITVGFGGVVPAAARRMADEALATLLREAGVTADSDHLHAGDLYLHPMPASLDQEAPPEPVRRVRPPDSSPAAVAIGEFDDLGRSRPAVYATFGTEFGSVAPWGPLVEALVELDVDAVVTTGAAGLPPGMRVPANILVREYVEQRDILGRVAVVVSHAGSGTLLGAAQRGVPQVCIPLGADQFENAEAAAARGIAVRVGPDARNVSALRDAIVRALTDRSMADAAAEVRDEIGQAAGPSEAVDWIEALVQGS